MQKTIFFLQTLFVSLLPCLLWGFNISLSFDTTTGIDTTQEQLIQTIMTPIKVGKGIKESQKEKGTYRIKTVVIDPGHGGHDPGCLGRGSQEKHLALAISKKVAAALQSRFPNIRVILTRDQDVFIPLHERAAIANRNDADLFISIHCNAMPAGHSHVHGTETYVMGLHTADHNLNVAKRENASILLEENYEKNYDYDPNSPEGHIMLAMFQNAYLEQSILFANKVEKEFHDFSKRKSRGVKQAGFVVLKETTMPSVLVEAGFLSNRKEEKFLKTKAGQDQIAIAILRAFEGYKMRMEEGTLLAAKPTTIPVKEVMVERNPRPSPLPPAKDKVEQFAYDPFSTPPTHKTETSTAEAPAVTRDKTYPVVPIQQEPKIISSTPPIQTPMEITPPAPPPAPAPPPVIDKTPEITAPIQFNVQLAAAPRPLNTSAGKWKNLNYLIEVIQESGMHKYQIRNLSGFTQALEVRRQVQSQGFSDAFVVAYKNGKRIPIEQAKRETIRP
jgi:N-acetylmuramoyl-L-alanine amidase